MTQSKNKRSIARPSAYLLTGSILAFIIAFSPYIFYLYEIFPDGQVWENSFFTYESLFYKSVLVAAWTYLGKITPLILLLIWFFTCKHWWYHSIIIPIAMYVYQILSTIYEDFYAQVNPMDTNQLIYLAPFFFIVLVILYMVRTQIFDRIYGIDLSELNETDVHVFSKKNTKDERELEEFRNQNMAYSVEPTEEYYRKL